MTIKASAILVDRLEHALDKQGVKMKRRALLETAAYAFAYASSNAFTAAAAKGDIDPPSVTVIGRLELPDGQFLLVVNDPLANSAYGIDEAFVETVVDGERRERIGVTPYGHLVNLHDLPDADFPELGNVVRGIDLTESNRLIIEAMERIDAYNPSERHENLVAQAEIALGRAKACAESGNAAGCRVELSAADELLSLVRDDDAERHVLWTRQTISDAVIWLSTAQDMKRDATTSDGDDDAALRPFLVSALEQIDLEIENRRNGEDPSAWADLQTVSDLGHAAVRNVKALIPGDDDEKSIRISRGDLELLLGAAESHSEDVNSGLDDGMYDPDENQDIEHIDQAIENVRLRLAMPVEARIEPAKIGKDGMITVHVARIEHKNGSDVRVALSEPELDAKVAEFCRDNWKEVSDRKGVPSDPAGMSDRQVVFAYYDSMEDMEQADHLDQSTFDLPLPGHGTTTKECQRCGTEIDETGLCRDETCPFSDHRQNDPQGWAGHPERDPNPNDDASPVPATGRAADAMGAYLASRPKDWADQVARVLEKGASADIWYDAHDHGTNAKYDPDRIAEDTIGETQSAMVEAARILRDLKPTLLPDGSIVVDGRMQSKTAIAERAAKDARDDIRYITYQDGEPGDVTVTMAATMGLGYANGRGDGVPITDAEHEWLGIGEKLNMNGTLPVSLGASAVWHGRKWLVAEIEFAFADHGDDGRDDAAALRRARNHMEHIAPYVEAMGGLMELDEDATEFAHELAILIPFEFAMESDTRADWDRALSYALSTEAEKKAGIRASAEYTAQQDMGRGVYSVEPIGDTVWDATFDALRWGRREAEEICEGTSFPDDYARSPMAPEWVRERSAMHPFEVQIVSLDDLYGITRLED